MFHKREILLTRFDRDNKITSAKNQFGFQDELFFHTKNQNNRSDNLTAEILDKSVNYTEGIHPKIFCRRWFGLAAINKNGTPRFTEGQISAMESEHGYREKCIHLIAKILKIKPNTVQRWGKGVAFNKIPVDKKQKYEIYLSYVDALRVIITSLEELDEASLLKMLQELEIR